jgi:signal peptidase I
MKRALFLLFIIAICIVGFLSIRGAMPFIPVVGSNMEPELQSGSLLMIDPIDPQDVAVGDIIVYSVPTIFREYYDYPPVVTHRAISVHTEGGLSFRTADVNSGEDPFLVRPQDIKGTTGKQIPYLGIPFLPFLSQTGQIFTIIALVLLALLLYGGDIKYSWHKIRQPIPSLATNREKRVNWMMARRLTAVEREMTATEQALEKFSAAIGDYAQHMSSHTSAIQGLSAASHELKRGAAEQNRILMRFAETREPPRARWKTPSWKIEHSTHQPGKPGPETKKPTAEPVVKKLAAEPVTEETVAEEPVVEKPVAEKPLAEPVHKTPEKHETQFPPGCARNRLATAPQAPPSIPRRPRSRRELISEALAAEREILEKVKRSAYQV